MGLLRSARRRTIALLAVGVWAAAGATTGAQAQPSLDRERQIKVAFVYNFIKFVDWPTEVMPESGDTISICALSDDPFFEALETINGKTVKGRRLAVRKVDAIKDLESCHVAFLGAAEETRLPQLMRSLQGSSVLTVGEMDRFAQSGGIINLVVVNNKVRFEVNVDRAERARLKLRSQLLSVATVVKE